VCLVSCNSLFRDREVAFSTTIFVGMVSIAILVSMCCCIPSARTRCCVAVCTRVQALWHPSRNREAKKRARQHQAAVSLVDMGRRNSTVKRVFSESSRRMLQAPHASPALHQRQRQQKQQSSIIGGALFIGAIVLMGVVYLSWNPDAILNQDVTRISKAVALEMANGVNEFTRAATHLVDTEIGAFRRGELPVTQDELRDPNKVVALERYLYDLFLVYVLMVFRRRWSQVSLPCCDTQQASHLVGCVPGTPIAELRYDVRRGVDVR